MFLEYHQLTGSMMIRCLQQKEGEVDGYDLHFIFVQRATLL
jgi:hypothetical protein